MPTTSQETPVAVTVRILMQVADQEPHEVSTGTVSSLEASAGETAQALRELADQIEQGTE